MALIRRKNIWYFKMKLNGKTVRRSTGQTSRAKAEKVARRFKKEVELRKKQPKNWLRLSKAIYREVEMIEMDVSPGQAERALYSLSTFLKWVGRDIELTSITFEMVEEYQRHRLKEKALATVQKDLNFLLRMLRNNGLDVRKPGPKRGKKTHIRAFTLEELRRIFETVTDHYRALYLTLLYTGARPAELVPSSYSEHKPLLKTEVDFDNGLIRIRQAKGKMGKRPPDRPPIQVPEGLLRLLREQIASTPESYPFVFAKGHNLARDFKFALKRAGIPQIDGAGQKLILHSFRHTYATLMATHVQNNPHLLKAILGHSKITTTDRYCQVKPQMVSLDSPGLSFFGLDKEDSQEKESEIEIIEVASLRENEGGGAKGGVPQAKKPPLARRLS